MADIGTVLGSLTPRESTVRVCVSGVAAAGLERALEVARSARRGKQKDMDTEAAVAAAREQVEAATFAFMFRAVPAKERSDLVAAHPSSDGGAWDGESFPPALVAASCVDPVMTPEQAAELMEGLPEADRASLFNAAFGVNYAANPTLTVSV